MAALSEGSFRGFLDGVTRVVRHQPALLPTVVAPFEGRERALAERIFTPSTSATEREAARRFLCALNDPEDFAREIDAIAASPPDELQGASRVAVEVAAALARMASVKEESNTAVWHGLELLAATSAHELAEKVVQLPNVMAYLDAAELPPRGLHGAPRTTFDHLAQSLDALSERHELARELLFGLPRDELEDEGVDPEHLGDLPRMLSQHPDLIALTSVALAEKLRPSDALEPLDDRLAHVDAYLAAWRAKHAARSQAGSRREALRAGAVGGAALALLLLDTALGDARAGVRPLAHAPEVFSLVGARDTAATADRRRDVLLALGALASVATRAHDDADARESVNAALASARDGKPAELAARCRATATALAERFPRADDPGVLAVARIAPRVANRRGAESLTRYVARMANAFDDGVEAAALERLVDALEQGTLDDVRDASMVPTRLVGASADLPRFDDLCAELRRGSAQSIESLVGSKSSYGLTRAVDEGGALAWCAAVDDARSCQSTYRSTDTSRGLLNRFEDGFVRLLGVGGDDGALRARAAARLVALPHEQRAALLVDVCYFAPGASDGERTEALAALAALARGRAEALGVPVLFTSEARYPSSGSEEHVRVAFPSLLAPDYLDFGFERVVDPRARQPAMHTGSVLFEEPVDRKRVASKARKIGIDVAA
jgi:hypothetical protein